MVNKSEERLENILRDPIYKRLPTRKRKVKLDPRFRGVLTDPKFTQKTYVDKRGRKVVEDHSHHLNMMYELENGGKPDSPAIIEKNKRKNIRGIRGECVEGDDAASSDRDSDEDIEMLIDDEELDVVARFKESAHEQAKPTTQITSRLAVCNLNWDRIDATDIYMIFHSFLPSQGNIVSVKVYVSEYGKEKLEKERQSGPDELLKSMKATNPHESNNLMAGGQIEEEFNNEAFREYQLQRLKYYYAIIQFDSPETSDHIYAECDGMDYEHSAMSVDLRFVPENTVFNENDVRSKCTDINHNYQPLEVIMPALQQTRLCVTWDESDPRRSLLTSSSRKYTFEEIERNSAELDKLIASPSSSSFDEEDRNVIGARRSTVYKELLSKLSIQEPPKSAGSRSVSESGSDEADGELFDPVTSSSEEDSCSQEIEKVPKSAPVVDLSQFEMPDNVKKVFEADPFFCTKPPKIAKNSGRIERNEEIPRPNRNEKCDSEETLIQKHPEKQPDAKIGFFGLMKKHKVSKNKAKKIVKQRKLLKAEEQTEVDTSDARFSALFSSSHYAVDPSDPSFRDSKSMNIIVNKQSSRRALSDMAPSHALPSQSLSSGKSNTASKNDDSLSQLIQRVKSIKTKPKFYESRAEKN